MIHGNHYVVQPAQPIVAEFTRLKCRCGKTTPKLPVAVAYLFIRMHMGRANWFGRGV